MAVISTGGNGAAIAQIFQALIEAEERKKDREYKEALRQQAMAVAKAHEAEAASRAQRTGIEGDIWGRGQQFVSMPQQVDSTAPFFTNDLSNPFGEMPTTIPNPERQAAGDDMTALLAIYRGMVQDTGTEAKDIQGLQGAFGNPRMWPQDVAKLQNNIDKAVAVANVKAESDKATKGMEFDAKKGIFQEQERAWGELADLRQKQAEAVEAKLRSGGDKSVATANLGQINNAIRLEMANEKTLRKRLETATKDGNLVQGKLIREELQRSEQKLQELRGYQDKHLGIADKRYPGIVEASAPEPPEQAGPQSATNAAEDTNDLEAEYKAAYAAGNYDEAKRLLDEIEKRKRPR